MSQLPCRGCFKCSPFSFNLFILSPRPTVSLSNQRIKSRTCCNPAWRLDSNRICVLSLGASLTVPHPSTRELLLSLSFPQWISDPCRFRLPKISPICSLCCSSLGYAIPLFLPPLSDVWPIHSHQHRQNIFSKC